MIVAVNDDEVSRLRNLYVRALTNEVPGIRLIDANELKQIEPHCRVSNINVFLRTQRMMIVHGVHCVYMRY